jgi:hypothetical protein
MTAVVFAPADICGGNSHAHVDLTIDGTLVFNDILLHRSEIQRPITADEVETLANILARIHCRNMTNQQLRTALTTGWNSTV